MSLRAANKILAYAEIRQKPAELKPVAAAPAEAYAEYPFLKVEYQLVRVFYQDKPKTIFSRRTNRQNLKTNRIN